MPTKKIEHIIVDGIVGKECPSCHDIKPIVDFHKDKSKSDGLCAYCKDCKRKKDKTIYMENPDKKKLSVKEYMKKTGQYYKYKPYNPAYYSSEESKKKKRARDLKRRLLLKNNSEYLITSDDISGVIEKYEGLCVYCGVMCIDNYHIDHKLPVSKGGGNNLDNLALSCPGCNWSKNDKTSEEFIAFRKKLSK